MAVWGISSGLEMPTFVALLAGRWVAGMAAAALSVRGLATALVVLRGALIRTGIGALIVGAGELVYQFTRLVSGAGGFGEAMSLLKDLAVEVWERILRSEGRCRLRNAERHRERRGFWQHRREHV